MTIHYCDFCGLEIKRDGDGNLQGDPVVLGDPETFNGRHGIPDANKEACADCFSALCRWVETKTRPGAVRTNSVGTGVEPLDVGGAIPLPKAGEV